MVVLLLRIRYVLLCYFAAIVLVSGYAESEFEKGGWDEIPEEELNVSSPKIDKEAHSEFLYRRLKVDDEDGRETTFSYHNRAKIFTEGGVLKWDKIDIAYQTGWRVSRVKARVIYPDGTLAILDKNDIYRRQIFKDDRFEGYAMSFSFPGLKPGCIVEYKWTESRAFWMPSLTIPLRAEWPTWKFDISVDAYKGLASSINRYNCFVSWEKKKGVYLLSLENQPAWSSKPHLVARKDFEPFIYMGYASELKMLTREKYWNYRGGGLIEVNKDFVKSKQKTVKELAARLFDPHKGIVEGMLRAAYDYCVNEITNIESYTDKYTEQEIEDLKKNDSPKKTITNGYGTRYDINAVFASLAAAAGFKARLAQVENHRVFSYNVKVLGSFNLSDWVVAIKYGEKWRYFDPGSSFLPFETLNSENMNANAIVTDEKFYYNIKTNEVEEDFSATVRIADAKIDEYGDLSGEIKIRYKGYSSLWRKRLFASMTNKEREEYVLTNEWQSRLPRTEIEDFRIKYQDERNGMLQVFYNIKIPGYADFASDRLVLNPSIFERGKQPLFTDEERVEPIAFDYKPKIQDKVSFLLPDSYVMESEHPIQASFEGKLLNRKSQAKQEEGSNVLIYQRVYDAMHLKVRSMYYSIMKEEFELANAEDTQPVSFVKTTASASNGN
jgi:hypothetical protein